MKIRGSPAQALTGATLGFFFGFSGVALLGATAQRFKAGAVDCRDGGLDPDGLRVLLETEPILVPLLLTHRALCGCDIVTFSVGICQVSYWFPRGSQGTALGVYGGVGNLAPGVFTLLLPLALATMGLSGAYGAWFLMLLAGT